MKHLKQQKEDKYGTCFSLLESVTGPLLFRLSCAWSRRKCFRVTAVLEYCLVSTFSPSAIAEERGSLAFLLRIKIRPPHARSYFYEFHSPGLIIPAKSQCACADCAVVCENQFAESTVNRQNVFVSPPFLSLLGPQPGNRMV